jgi:hypothetical protein
MTKHVLLVTAVAALIAPTAPPASAGGSRVVRAGCSLSSAGLGPQLATRGGDTVGVLAANAVLADGAVPVAGSVRCYLASGGVELLSTVPVPGVGAVASAGAGLYFDPPGVEDLCVEVMFLDGATPYERCDGDIAAGGAVDGAACPALAALSPGLPGVADIAGDGDVALLGSQVWDCPPYAP